VGVQREVQGSFDGEQETTDRMIFKSIISDIVTDHNPLVIVHYKSFY